MKAIADFAVGHTAQGVRWSLMILVLSLCLSGCVQRRMTIRSNPPGAVVYVDDYEIGTTPVSTDFTYYGTRKIRLVKDGYETLEVMQPVSTPWYEIPGIDFFSENCVPGQIRDRRTFEFQLVPQVMVPTEQLLQRGEGLRQQTHASGVVRTSTGQATPPARRPASAGNPRSVAPAGSVPPSAPSSGIGGQLPLPVEPPGGWSSPVNQ